MKRRAKNTIPKRGQASPINKVLQPTESVYRFLCKLRNPKFQKELLKFLAKFPILFVLQENRFPSYGRFEQEARREVKDFLSKHRDVLKYMRAWRNHQLYQLIPVRGRYATFATGMIMDWVRDFSRTLMFTYWNSESRPKHLFSEVDTGWGYLRCFGIQDVTTTDYYQLVGRSASEFNKDESRFLENWHQLPHSVRYCKPDCTLAQEQVSLTEGGAKIYIPVFVSTTLDDLIQNWPDIKARQATAYGKKRRTGATDWGRRLKIYDLSQAGKKPDEMAVELRLKCSTVRKDLERVRRDVHGLPWRSIKPKESRRRWVRTSDERARNHGVPARYSGQTDELLKWASVETGIPLPTLRLAQSDRSVLTPEQQFLLHDCLVERMRERQTQMSFPTRHKR